MTLDSYKNNRTLKIKVTPILNTKKGPRRSPRSSKMKLLSLFPWQLQQNAIPSTNIFFFTKSNHSSEAIRIHIEYWY